MLCSPCPGSWPPLALRGDPNTSTGVPVLLSLLWVTLVGREGDRQMWGSPFKINVTPDKLPYASKFHHKDETILVGLLKGLNEKTSEVLGVVAGA